MAAAAIETAFVALAQAVDGVASAVDHEPGVEGLPALPCVTMLYRGARRSGQSTGGYEDLEHTWDIELYLPLKQYAPAQEQLRELVQALVTAARRDPTLGSTCDVCSLLDELARPNFVHDQDDRPAMVTKRLVLRARTEEN